jgi:hypothetical protein
MGVDTQFDSGMTRSRIGGIFRFGCDLGPGGGEDVEERADPVSVLGGVPEQAVPVHGVYDAPPVAGAGEVPGGLPEALAQTAATANGHGRRTQPSSPGS